MTLEHRHPDAGLGPPLLAVTAGGVYATVPDTELVIPVLGALVTTALLGGPRAWGRLGAAAGAPLAVLYWVAANDGLGRESSIVGAIGSLGLLLVVPLVPRQRVGFLAALAVHAGLVALGSRVAGTQGSAVTAALILGTVVVLAIGAGTLTARRASRR
jgi:hypothetical protein